MTRSVAPIAHNSSTHDCIWSVIRKKQTKKYKKFNFKKREKNAGRHRVEKSPCTLR
ncbi:hypothetical protein H477_5687 [[Clostridium] sordellii ATCC 9714]|nr:hypothetical protein H477_5687 [[Clostridium] sordellii ATCC 9714] [Paeniclostridium sordellii ATCC 9714]